MRCGVDLSMSGVRCIVTAIPTVLSCVVDFIPLVSNSVIMTVSAVVSGAANRVVSAVTKIGLVGLLEVATGSVTKKTLLYD